MYMLQFRIKSCTNPSGACHVDLDRPNIPFVAPIQIERMDNRDNHIKLSELEVPAWTTISFFILCFHISFAIKFFKSPSVPNLHHGVLWWVSDRRWDQLSTRTPEWIQGSFHNCNSFYSFCSGDYLGFSKIPCSMAYNSWIQDGWLDHLSRLCKPYDFILYSTI